MTATPYVSFVTYGRNDAYTPSYVRRVNRAMACLARQLESAGIDGEIIVADWNPPAGRPHLIDVLDVPSRLRHVSIRGIVVEPEHHLALRRRRRARHPRRRGGQCRPPSRPRPVRHAQGVRHLLLAAGHRHAGPPRPRRGHDVPHRSPRHRGRGRGDLAARRRRPARQVAVPALDAACLDPSSPSTGACATCTPTPAATSP